MQNRLGHSDLSADLNIFVLSVGQNALRNPRISAKPQTVSDNHKQKNLMKISILILAFFLLFSCKQNAAETIEEAEQISTDVRNETNENAEVSNKEILGVWTNGAHQNANFEITPKTFYYVDDFKDYEYTLENDSIAIKYPDYVYRAKIILKGDSLIMNSKKFGQSKYWRFKE